MVKLFRDATNFTVNMDGAFEAILFFCSGGLLMWLIFYMCKICYFDRQPPQTTLENGASASPLPANLYSRQDNRSSVWTVQNPNRFLNEDNVAGAQQSEAESRLKQYDPPPSYWEVVDDNQRHNS